ncbi:MAG TPA: hypothetical protein VHT70_04940 [Candidatus Saccharimonadales bacterium]|jgi:hypothetical protein|nr:hypothetical protein [Candidatus Saccharimonadales bacterium]
MKAIDRVRVSVDSNNDTVPAVITRSAQAAEQHTVPHYAVIATGWCGGNGTTRGLATGMVRAAVRSGRHDFAVVTYDDPVVGSSAYGQSYKSERFAALAERFAGARPVTAIGHSRGWLSVAETGKRLVSDEAIDAAIGLTPIGLQSSRTRKQTVRALGYELAMGTPSMRRLQGIRALGCLARAATPHMVTRPKAAFREIVDMLEADVTEQTIALSSLTPTSLIRSTDDRLASGYTDPEALCEAGYRGTFAEIGGTHFGVVADPHRAAAIYRNVIETEFLAHAER